MQPTGPYVAVAVAAGPGEAPAAPEALEAQPQQEHAAAGSGAPSCGPVPGAGLLVGSRVPVPSAFLERSFDLHLLARDGLRVRVQLGVDGQVAGTFISSIAVAKQLDGSILYYLPQLDPGVNPAFQQLLHSSTPGWEVRQAVGLVWLWARGARGMQ